MGTEEEAERHGKGRRKGGEPSVFHLWRCATSVIMIQVMQISNIADTINAVYL